MADREFRVNLTGNSSVLVGASREATTAMKSASAGADELGKHAAESGNGFSELNLKTAGFRRELLVLTHELSQGNYSKFGGSLLVLAERADATKLVFSFMGAAILGSIAAVAGFAFAVFKGAAELRAFNDAQQLTNNFAGQTEASFNSMAHAVSSATLQSAGHSRELLQALIETGRFGPENLQLVATAASELKHLTGKTTQETVAEFAKMTDSATKWADETNSKYHFLSLAQFEQIRQLEELGRGTDAQRVALVALSEQNRVHVGTIGAIESAWNAAKAKVLGYIEAVANVGKGGSIVRQLEIARGRLADAEAANNSKGVVGLSGRFDAEIAEQKSIIAALESSQHLADQVAAATAKSNGEQDRGIKASKFLKELDDRTKGADTLKNALAKLRLEQEAYNKANPGNPLSAAVVARQEAKVREENTKKGGKGTRDDSVSIAQTQFKESIAGVQGFVDAEAEIYKSRNESLKKIRAADLIGDQSYLQGLANANEIFLRALGDALQGDELLIEERRKKADPKEQAQLDKELTDLRIKFSKEQAVATNALGQSYLQADESAQRWARDELARNKKLGAELILDSRARAQALAAIDIEERERQVSLLIEGTDARKRAEDQLADFIVLRNQQLTQQLKPEWQKMLEGFQDTVSYMRKASDDFNTGFINGGRDAFVSFVTTGKLSVTNLTQFIEQQFAKMAYDRFLAKSVSDLGSNLFDGAGSFFSAVGGLFTGGSATGGIGFSNAAGISGGRASGGPVAANATYLVGEQGPELLRLGSQSGSVVPNGKLGGALSVVYSPSITIDSRTDQLQVAQLVQASVANGNRQLLQHLKDTGAIS